MNNLIRVLPEILFPGRWPLCDDVLPFGGRRICDSCKVSLPYVGEDYCLKCGRPLKQKTAEFCPACQRGTHSFDSGRSLFVYNDAVRHSLALFKYKNRREYALFYAEELYKTFNKHIKMKRPDALVPVPVSKSRLRRRGYNQAELLARELGRLTGIPVRTGYISRIRDTPALKELGRRQRQKNLKKAFKITGNDVKLKTIMVIDDIFTTGSTMDEISSVFKEAGVEKVYFLTVAAAGVV